MVLSSNVFKLGGRPRFMKNEAWINVGVPFQKKISTLQIRIRYESVQYFSALPASFRCWMWKASLLLGDKHWAVPSSLWFLWKEKKPPGHKRETFDQICELQPFLGFTQKNKNYSRWDVIQIMRDLKTWTEDSEATQQLARADRYFHPWAGVAVVKPPEARPSLICRQQRKELRVGTGAMCISYLWLWNKSPQTLTKHHILPHSFCGWGIHAWLGRGPWLWLSSGCNVGVGQGYNHLKAALQWRAGLSSSWAVGEKFPSVSCPTTRQPASSEQTGERAGVCTDRRQSFFSLNLGSAIPSFLPCSIH